MLEILQRLSKLTQDGASVLNITITVEDRGFVLSICDKGFYIEDYTNVKTAKEHQSEYSDNLCTSMLEDIVLKFLREDDISIECRSRMVFILEILRGRA